MRFNAGDRIEVTNNTLGAAARQGQVLETSVNGGLRVRWSDGHESMFMPGSNCRVITGMGEEQPARLGCHVDVAIVEDDHVCRATAKVFTSRGAFEGHGIARLKPGDVQVPRIGEELALGRALAALSERLLATAAGEIAAHPTDHDHLLV